MKKPMNTPPLKKVMPAKGMPKNSMMKNATKKAGTTKPIMKRGMR
jgi:hypothetical protein